MGKCKTKCIKFPFITNLLNTYENLDDNLAKRINKAIEEISKNPFQELHIRRLKGKYRYSLGDLRIIYSVNTKYQIVFIETIGQIGDIYK